MMVIPGELIALVTFPGVILHEISHRFFCDINDIDVYEIKYFIPFSKQAGCLTHKRTDNLMHAFFVAFGPLIINSIVCMLLTFPMAVTYYLNTDFASLGSGFHKCAYIILSWLGYSIGFNAIPSNQDVAELCNISQSWFSRAIMGIFKLIINLLNIPFLAFFISIFYTIKISLILPKLILG